MKVGDMVRFALWEDLEDVNNWSTTPKKRIGLLVKYDSLMKTASVLCEDKVVKVRAQLVEKAGRKDIEMYQGEKENAE